MQTHEIIMCKLYKRLMLFTVTFAIITIHKKVGTYYKVIEYMNLHEQCLLRYLQNPDELSYSTEILKLNNFILEKQFVLKNFVAKSSSFNYTERTK